MALLWYYKYSSSIGTYNSCSISYRVHSQSLLSQQLIIFSWQASIIFWRAS